MRKLASVLILFFIVFLTSFIFANAAEARVRVRGYYKPKSGTYVQPHYRSSPNRSLFDNWSTKGNLNPYTGRWGTRDPFKSYYRWRY
jgi:hypothetical protein